MRSRVVRWRAREFSRGPVHGARCSRGPAKIRRLPHGTPPSPSRRDRAPASSAPTGARRPAPARSRSAWSRWRARMPGWCWRWRATATPRVAGARPARVRRRPAGLHFPDWETLPYDLFSPHPDIVSQRVAALYRLPSTQRGVLVVPVSSLMQRLPPPSWIAGNALDLASGARLDMDTEKRRLESAGYRNVPQVLDPGDFAVRGALLDLLPDGLGRAVPHRAVRRRHRHAAQLRPGHAALATSRSSRSSCCRRASSRSTRPAPGACARR